MPTKDNLSDRIALVTGASRGIGQAIAIELGQQGATLIATGTSDRSVEKIDAMLAEYNIAGKGIVLDTSSRTSIDTFFETLKTEFRPPDILVNNAGITRDNLLMRMKTDEWDAVIQTNLNGIFYLSKLCLKGMLKNRWGRMINISSTVASVGMPGQSNYAAAKAGVIAFSKSLAQEVATRNITVNVVAPGFITSDMTDTLPKDYREQWLEKIPVGAFGKTEDIANAVSFLASEKAGYITGQTLHVNGGLYMP